jgi:hypothetical protein
VLEETPRGCRFVLTCSGTPLATIASRAEIIRCGLLSDAQVASVLVSRGMDPAVAARLAPLGGGRVRPAMQAVVDTQSKARVTAVLRAVAARDTALLDRALAGWDDEAHVLLTMWAYESASGRWRRFTPESVPGLGQADARDLLVLLGRQRARAPLAARAALTRLAAR